MFSEQVSTYRNLITLKDGARVLLRLLTPDDRSRLIEMFAHASPDDVKYLRDPVTDGEMVGRWVEQLDYSRVLPLVAVVQDRLVGDATLHFRKGPARHVGEVRIFLTKDFRRRGLGSQMLCAVIDLARKAGLHLLVAEVVADQTKVIKAFRHAGFQIQCSFEDFFMFPDGETGDVMMLTMRLIPREEEF
ncbi:MAG: GNAT family N-acetyltransferase [Chloroflexi bacterium]|nr:GNAT family N-acetyltransferase [Chloroflexota bacterium]MBI3761365.1 GNAT family N-acetyltransferase [Chloroflexota bacterium]